MNENIDVDQAHVLLDGVTKLRAFIRDGGQPWEDYNTDAEKGQGTGLAGQGDYLAFLASAETQLGSIIDADGKAGPVAHVRFSYTFDQLTDDAKQKALKTVADKLSGNWFDDGNREDIASTIVMSLAVSVAYPGHENYGEGDFPGIDGVKLESWDADRAEAGFHGALTRENAPGLDWPDEVYAVDLDARRFGGTAITVELDEDTEETAEVTVVADGFKQTVREKIQEAATAGQGQAEYIGSEENAQEYIDGNEPDFTEDGDLF